MLWISLLDFDPASVCDVHARSEQQLGMCTEPLGTCTVTAGYAQKHLAKCTESLDIYIKLYKTFFRPQPGTAPVWSPGHRKDVLALDREEKRLIRLLPGFENVIKMD